MTVTMPDAGVVGAFRQKVVDALSAAPELVMEDGPVVVHDGPPDALHPPAYLLVSPDPWMLPAGYCAWQVRLQVVCVAGRITPMPGMDHLEQMVVEALRRMKSARVTVEQVGPAAGLDIAGVSYLAARVTVQTVLNLEGT